MFRSRCDAIGKTLEPIHTLVRRLDQKVGYASSLPLMIRRKLEAYATYTNDEPWSESKKA